MTRSHLDEEGNDYPDIPHIAVESVESKKQPLRKKESALGVPAVAETTF